MQSFAFCEWNRSLFPCFNFNAIDTRRARGHRQEYFTSWDRTEMNCASNGWGKFGWQGWCSSQEGRAQRPPHKQQVPSPKYSAPILCTSLNCPRPGAGVIKWIGTNYPTGRNKSSRLVCRKLRAGVGLLSFCVVSTGVPSPPSTSLASSSLSATSSI